MQNAKNCSYVQMEDQWKDIGNNRSISHSVESQLLPTGYNWKITETKNFSRQKVPGMIKNEVSFQNFFLAYHKFKALKTRCVEVNKL